MHYTIQEMWIRPGSGTRPGVAHWIVFWWGVLTVLLASSMVSAQPEGEPVKKATVAVRPPLGSPAPDFRLKDLSGRTHVLRDLRADPETKRPGYVVVLVWWAATGPAAAKTDPILNRLQRTYHDRGVRFLAVNPFADGSKTERRGTEPVALVREFKRIRGLRFPVLLDGDRQVTRRYGARCVPEVAVIDRQGLLRYRGAVVTPLIKPGERQFSAYLEDALRAVLAGKRVQHSETKSWGNTIP